MAECRRCGNEISAADVQKGRALQRGEFWYCPTCVADARAAKGAPAAEIVPEGGLFQTVSFAGLVLYPHENLLVGASGASTKLTTSENRVLLHFVSNPWVLCTREAIAEALYGSQRPSSDRAVDVIVTRLRKKIAGLAGPAAQHLIKTEFRRGYVFVAEVSCDAPPMRREAESRLHARSA